MSHRELLREALTPLKGQDHAVNSWLDAMCVVVEGLGVDGDKPALTALFLGPTGTGKTEMSKLTSQAVFGRKVVALDMTNYPTAESFALFVRDLEEAVGGDQEPGVLLVDEIEKCDGAIMRMFYPILDEGRFESSGVVLSFRGWVIIATSNAGDKGLANISEGATASVKEKAARTILRKHIGAPLMARFTEVLVFGRLPRLVQVEIARLAVAKARKKAEKAKNCQIIVDETAQRWVNVHGITKADGARPVEGMAKKAINNSLARLTASGAIVSGRTVVVSTDAMHKEPEAYLRSELLEGP